jgi:TRAP-type C4-dicarboxylate transport system permease small subunit
MKEEPRKSFVERAQMIIYRVEDSILVGLLLLMITLAVLQIFLRNLFETGIVWSDVLVRILVLWVGLAGAMVASRQGNHINIDIMERFLSERAKVVVNFIVEVFTAFICTIVAYYSLQFVQMEFADGGMAFAKVPVWLCEAIIPFAFVVIAIRYVLLSIINLKKIVKFPS